MSVTPELPRTTSGQSPLQKLARLLPGEDEPFLSPHHIVAGERFSRLFNRSHLQPRVTMNYSAASVARSGGSGAADASDLALDARQRLAILLEDLPRECGGVLLDVCGFEKGLQQVETERRWPRRSAKLILRVALDQLARRWGLSPIGEGRDQGYLRAEREALRPVDLGGEEGRLLADAADHGDEPV